MLFDLKKLFRIGILILVLLGITLLIMHQTRGVLSGPTLTIDEPIDGMTSTISAITLSGSTQHLARLVVNNHDAPARVDGTFSFILLIAPGNNFITRDAYDRFQKHTQKRLRIYGDFEEYDLDHGTFDSRIEKPIVGTTPVEDVVPVTDDQVL